MKKAWWKEAVVYQIYPAVLKIQMATESGIFKESDPSFLT